MNHKGEEHFRGEQPTGGIGMEVAYQQLHRATGKMIAKVRFGDDPSTDAEVHQGEYIVFEFTDGSALEILTGSNGGNLAGPRRDLKASDIACSFVPIFHETPAKAHH